MPCEEVESKPEMPEPKANIPVLGRTERAGEESAGAQMRENREKDEWETHQEAIATAVTVTADIAAAATIVSPSATPDARPNKGSVGAKEMDAKSAGLK